jgi:rod shape-determining protein MreC
MVRPLIALSLFFFVCNRLFFFAPSIFETGASYLVTPLLQIQQQIFGAYKRRCERKATQEQLMQTIAQLEQERDLLRATNVQLQATMAYATSVQELLAFKSKYEQKPLCIASIIMRHITDNAHYVIIDAGAEQGIVPDMVAVYQSQLIGRVTEVWPRSSKIVLVTDQSSKVAVLCVGSNIQGIHEGACHLHESTVSHISHLLTVTEQDLVVSSGQGMVFPYGLALGVITSVVPDGMHQNVVVKPLIDIRAIEKVWILNKKV